MPSTALKSSTASTLVFISALTLAHTSVAHADQWSWTAGSGNWTSAGNWTPIGIPGLDPFATTNIDIGNLPGVQNSTVTLSLAPVGPLTFSDLDIRSGMTLDTGGGQLTNLWGETTLGDLNTTLIIRASAGPNFHDMTSHQVVVGAGTYLEMADGGRLRAWDLINYGVISGEGTIHLQDGGNGITMSNSGIIEGSGNGGLTLIQEGTAHFDLDGSEEDGQLLLATPFSQITMEGTHPIDTYGGVITMGSGSLLTMNFSEGWTADSFGSLNVSSSIPGAAAQIAGGHVNLSRPINVGGTHGHLRVLADATFNNLTEVFLGTNDVLEMDGETNVSNATFELSQGARVNFDGPARMASGTFDMVSNSYLDGVVNFNGESEWDDNGWDGEVTFNGTARINDTATVNGISVINAAVLDMDGASNDSIWFIRSPLTVNAGQLDTAVANPNSMDGSIDIGDTIQARLTLNLTNPGEAWQMGGTLQLRGIGPLTVTRVSGSPLQINGYLTVFEGTSIITSDLTIDGSSQLHIANGSTLRARGTTRVEAGIEVFGSGMLQNGVDGDMTLDTGVDLGAIGLRNDAQLGIGESGAGIATVDRFMAMPTSNWSVEIGGDQPATEFDRLEVAGDVELAGTLTVERINGFEPKAGATFEFLAWSGTRTGQFDAVVSCDGAQVIYGRQSAWIEFASGISIPGDLNDDGVVDGNDLAIVLGQWGGCPSSCCAADLNHDGTVDGADIALVLGLWTT